MNFGTLKDIFTEKLIESYLSEDKKGKDLYKNFLKILKENKTLKTAFIVFKNIENKTINNEVIANEYLKECISLFDGFKGKNSLKEQTKKLLSLLEGYDVEYLNKKTKPLHESLQNLLTTKKSVSNLNKINEDKVNIINWLVTEKETINESEEESYIRQNVDPQKFLNLAVEKFNEKYKDSLTEEEKNILKVLRENNLEKTKTLVSELSKEAISLVNYHLKENNDNVTIKSKLLETKDTIYQIMEDNKSFGQNVLRLYELKENLKND